MKFQQPVVTVYRKNQSLLPRFTHPTPLPLPNKKQAIQATTLFEDSVVFGEESREGLLKFVARTAQAIEEVDHESQRFLQAIEIQLLLPGDFNQAFPLDHGTAPAEC
jgi:hypothetical protein